MNPELEKFKEKAKSQILSTWRAISENYTLGWGGPLDAVNLRYPFISEAVADVRDRVEASLPLVIYQTRETPPALYVGSSALLSSWRN